jgi:hypothetical protein
MKLALLFAILMIPAVSAAQDHWQDPKMTGVKTGDYRSFETPNGSEVHYVNAWAYDTNGKQYFVDEEGHRITGPGIKLKTIDSGNFLVTAMDSRRGNTLKIDRLLTTVTGAPDSQGFQRAGAYVVQGEHGIKILQAKEVLGEHKNASFYDFISPGGLPAYIKNQPPDVKADLSVPTWRQLFEDGVKNMDRGARETFERSMEAVLGRSNYSRPKFFAFNDSIEKSLGMDKDMDLANVFAQAEQGKIDERLQDVIPPEVVKRRAAAQAEYLRGIAIGDARAAAREAGKTAQEILKQARAGAAR